MLADAISRGEIIKAFNIAKKQNINMKIEPLFFFDRTGLASRQLKQLITARNNKFI